MIPSFCWSFPETISCKLFFALDTATFNRFGSSINAVWKAINPEVKIAFKDGVAQHALAFPRPGDF